MAYGNWGCRIVVISWTPCADSRMANAKFPHLVQPYEQLPCGLVVRIRRSHRRGRGSIPRTGAMFCSTFQIYNFTSNETSDPYVLVFYFFDFYFLTLNIICRDSKIILKCWWFRGHGWELLPSIRPSKWRLISGTKTSLGKNFWVNRFKKFSFWSWCVRNMTESMTDYQS